MMKIEYVISMEENSTLINNKEKILHILTLDDEFDYPCKGNKEQAVYEGMPFSIKISELLSKDSKKKYFDVSIETSQLENDDTSSALTKLNRKFIKFFTDTFHHRPKVLWSDLDSYYSTKAYPLIKDIENLMRKVITKLLIVQSGFAWESENLSQGAKQKVVKNKGRDIESNYLSGLDFIELTEIIFEKYSKHSSNVIFDNLEKSTTLEQVDKIKAILPKSNWERFINEYLDMTEDELVSKWKKIYDYRCAVAHNANFSKNDYEECSGLISSIKPILANSLKALDKSLSESSSIDASKKLQDGESDNKTDSNLPEISKVIDFIVSNPEAKPGEEVDLWSSLFSMSDFYDEVDNITAESTSNIDEARKRKYKIVTRYRTNKKHRSTIKEILEDHRIKSAASNENPPIASNDEDLSNKNNDKEKDDKP